MPFLSYHPRAPPICRTREGVGFIVHNWEALGNHHPPCRIFALVNSCEDAYARQMKQVSLLSLNRIIAGGLRRQPNK